MVTLLLVLGKMSDVALNVEHDSHPAFGAGKDVVKKNLNLLPVM